jgi:hypothetical protein
VQQELAAACGERDCALASKEQMEKERDEALRAKAEMERGLQDALSRAEAAEKAVAVARTMATEAKIAVREIRNTPWHELDSQVARLGQGGQMLPPKSSSRSLGM